jgi:hypothetical protein
VEAERGGVASGWVVACGRAGGWREIGPAGREWRTRSVRGGDAAGACRPGTGRRSVGDWGKAPPCAATARGRPWSLGCMESAAAELPGRQAPAAPDPGRAGTSVEVAPLPENDAVVIAALDLRRAARDSMAGGGRGKAGARDGGSGRRSGRPSPVWRRGGDQRCNAAVPEAPPCGAPQRAQKSIGAATLAAPIRPPSRPPSEAWERRCTVAASESASMAPSATPRPGTTG